MRPPCILILCTGNSCRSHLAEGILKHALGDGFRVESAGSKPAARRGPDPLPMLTDEQVAGKAKWIHARLVLLIDALDAETWDGRWTNRLMSAWLAARNTLEDAATWKGNTDGVARLVDADEAEEDKPAAGGNPADGSGSPAGEA